MGVLDAIPVEGGLLALAVDLERALVAHGIRAAEDPVLPRGEAPEDARLHRLRAAEAQVGLEAAQRVGRHRRPLLERDADLVVPVDIVRRRGDKPRGGGGRRVERLPDRGTRFLELRGIAVEEARQPRAAVHHRIRAEIHLPERDRGCARVGGQGEQVGTVRGERELVERPGEARTGLDEREERARGDVEASEGAPQQADHLAHEAVGLVGLERGVARQHGGGVALGLENPGADVELVGAQRQDRVVELARHRERPPERSRRFDRGEVARSVHSRSPYGERCRAPRAIDRDLHPFIVEPVACVIACERRQRHGLRARARARAAQRQRAFAHDLGELPGLGERIDQLPIDGALAAHALGGGAEDVGVVVAHAALVRQARQASGARQHPQQRDFGKRHGRRSVVDQDDLVAGERQLVAAARASAVQRRDEADPRVARGVLDGVARLVGELAEVDFPRVAREAQHEDVRARAEDALIEAREDHGPNLGMLEADAVQRIGELDVHAEVVGVELELVAGTQPRILGDVHREGRDRAVEGEVPVAVAGGVDPVIEGGRGCIHVGYDASGRQAMNASVPPPPGDRFNFAQHLLEANRGRAQSIAYIDDHERMTYGELDERVRGMAAALGALGLRREERVLLLMHDNNDWPIAFLGALYAGVVPVAVNTLLSADDYAYILGHCRARGALVSQALQPMLERAMQQAPHELGFLMVSRPEGALPKNGAALRGALAANAPLDRPASTGPEDIAFWLYSSGSTGRPKGALHTHANPYWTAELYGKAVLGMNERDLCFSAAKLFFAYGLGNALSFPLSVGASFLLMAERPTPDAVFKRWTGHKPTMFFGAPTGYAGMLASPNLPAKGAVALRLCSSAGEALPRDLDALL